MAESRALLHLWYQVLSSLYFLNFSAAIMQWLQVV